MWLKPGGNLRHCRVAWFIVSDPNQAAAVGDFEGPLLASSMTVGDVSSLEAQVVRWNHVRLNDRPNVQLGLDPVCGFC
jgi:hypothetical protein